MRASNSMPALLAAATLMTLAMILAAAPTARAAIGVRPPEAPAGRISQESYEVFLGSPSSAIGSFEQRVGYLTAAGAFQEVSLPEDLGESILVKQQFARPGGSSGPSVLGFVLTSAAVAAISVDGGPPIATRPALGAPYGLRSVLYEIPGVRLSELDARQPPQLLRSVLTPLDGAGTPITAAAPPHSPLAGPALETRSWDAPARGAIGICQITAGPFPGLGVRSGSVVSILRPLIGAVGRPYLTCADTKYVYHPAPGDESSLTAFMVLDADRPGVAPAAMASMEPVAGHPGVFQSRPPGAGLLARRVPGAWLLVEEGRDLQQRLSLLGSLRGSVLLHAKPIHHRASPRRRA